MIEIIFILQIIIAIFAVAYLVYQYALEKLSLYVYALVYLTWLLSFSIVFLLPYDIYASSSANYTMNIVWRTIYLLIFLLTWIILPMAQEYQSAGQFTFRQKIKRAIINNLIIYGIFAAIGFIFLAYLIIKDQFSMSEIINILMAASNAFGMFLVVIFLSYGLVAIPKGLWRQQKYEVQLKHKQFSITTINHKKSSIMYQFELKVKELLWMKQKNGQTQQIRYILNSIPKEYLQKWSNNIPNLGQIDLIKTHCFIKQIILQLNRLKSRQQQIQFQSFKIQDIINNLNQPTKRIQSTLINHSKYQIVEYFRWVWYCRLRILIIPILAIFFTLFTIAIIIAQFSAFTAFMPSFISSLNPFSHITDISSFIILDITLVTVLLYMVFCVYYALFKLKFANFFGLYWNKQTDGASLIFFSINCSRISNPLGYNFLQIINDKSTSFSQVMGITDIVPVFGQTFSILFPLLLIILILFNALDVYSRLAKIFKLQKFQFETEFDHKNIEQGRKLLQKARFDLQTKILSSNSKNLHQYKSYQSQKGSDIEFKTNKDSYSSDKINIKCENYNNYSNMNDVVKIFNM